MTLVADHLDNTGLNAIVKSALLESMYIINQEKTPLQIYVTTAVLSLSLHRLILPYFRFLLIVFKCMYCF